MAKLTEAEINLGEMSVKTLHMLAHKTGDKKLIRFAEKLHAKALAYRDENYDTVQLRGGST